MNKDYHCDEHGDVSAITLNYDGQEIGVYCFLCVNKFFAGVLPQAAKKVVVPIIGAEAENLPVEDNDLAKPDPALH